MKKKIDFKSEDGAALVLEAVIVYPIALVAVMFLILWGVTFLQRGYLQYCSSQLSSYIAKCVVYPGYEKIVPFFEPNKVSIYQSVNDAMDVHNPYRYLLGFDKELKGLIDTSCRKMADSYVPGKGFLKAEDGSVRVPDDMGGGWVTQNEDGYVCAIIAKSGFSEVYIGQNYIFADFLRVIGLGGKKMTIYGRSLQYMSDSAELVRVTDWAFDTIDMVIQKLGWGDQVEKIKATVNKIVNMGQDG